jgi:methylenetetrahydrofolate reductase (NADPH)
MHLKTKLDSSEFLILAEMQTPKGVDVSAMVTSANKVKGDVDAFVVPEMSNAVMKMSALGGAIVLQSRGFETVMQMCCRDRNRLALQADLLAAHALGICNIMVVAGEDPSYGDHHTARAVCDLSLEELLKAIQVLQKGRDLAGVELSGAPAFVVGSTINAGAHGGALDREIEELDKKMAEGVEFFITTPVFDLDGFSGFLKKLGSRKARIIPTVMLLKSVGMARYIDRNLKSVSIPETLIHRLQKAPDKVRECVLIAADLVSGLKEVGCSGALIATIGWEDKLRDILDRIKS